MIYSVRCRVGNVCDHEVLAAAIKGETIQKYYKIGLIFNKKHKIKDI